MQRTLFAFALLAAAVVATAGLLQARDDGGLNAGRALAEQGDIAGALEIYRQLVEKRPDWVDAHAHLGGMQLVNQQYQAAVLSFQQAISLGADGRQSFVGMGMAYLHLGQYVAARAAFDEAKARGTDDTDDIDNIISWLDARDPAVPKAHP